MLLSFYVSFTRVSLSTRTHKTPQSMMNKMTVQKRTNSSWVADRASSSNNFHQEICGWAS